MPYFKAAGEPHTPGVYVPSEHIGEYVHFSVMDPQTSGLIAITGYYHKKDAMVVEACVKDYLHFAECIQQAQLYSLAPQIVANLQIMFDIKTTDDKLRECKAQLYRLLNQVENFEEAYDRILGEGSYRTLKIIQGLPYVGKSKPSPIEQSMGRAKRNQE